MNIKLKLLFFSAIFLINIFFIIYYQTFIYRAFFNSDAAIANILAQEIIERASYYPNDWWYVNGDIWTLFKHTLVIPLTLFGFNEYDKHTIVVIGFFAFSLFMTYLYLKKIGVDKLGILVAFVGISTLYSPMYAREVFGESAYIWYYTALISYLYLFFILSKEEMSGKKRWIIKFLLVMITIAFVAENPSRFAIYFMASLFIPLFLFYEYINIQYKKIVLYFTIGLIFGLFYRYSILSNILMQVGAEKTFLISLDELPQHIWRSFIGLANLYGADWREKTLFTSLSGITYMLKSLLYPIAFLAPLYYAIKNRAKLNSFEIYTIAVGYIAFCIVFGIYAITSLHNNGIYAARANIRYVIPFLLFISISNGIIWKFFSQKIKFLLMLSIALAYLSIPNVINRDLSNEIVKDREEIIETLIANGLKKGYAPYWHSHIYTVLSNNRVQVRPLEYSDTRTKGQWLTSFVWYDKEYVDKDSFMLIPLDEVDEFEETTKELDLPKAVKTIDTKRYKIYIFDQNPINSKSKG